MITKYTKILFETLSRKKESPFNISNDSEFVVGNNVKITNTQILLKNQSKLIINDNVILKDYIINIENGECTIEKHNIIEKGNQPLPPSITIKNGKLFISNHNNINATFLIRFKGICNIGQYNSINENTEFRCDERISVGDFNMISYDCLIYDTNTHCIYKPEERRKLTKNDFPSIGVEKEKPKTKPILIGNDCWIGKRATILKGSTLENNTILGTNSVLSGTIRTGMIATGNPAKKVKNINFHR